VTLATRSVYLVQIARISDEASMCALGVLGLWVATVAPSAGESVRSVHGGICLMTRPARPSISAPSQGRGFRSFTPPRRIPWGGWRVSPRIRGNELGSGRHSRLFFRATKAGGRQQDCRHPGRDGHDQPDPSGRGSCRLITEHRRRSGPQLRVRAPDPTHVIAWIRGGQIRILTLHHRYCLMTRSICSVGRRPPDGWVRTKSPRILSTASSALAAFGC
jgi:hypothetical protein